jgi:Fe-S cluster biosynthesis and repair protein YggX
MAVSLPSGAVFLGHTESVKRSPRCRRWMKYRADATPRVKAASMARTVQCIKLGQEAEGLDFPPYPGELGKRIWENVSKQAWADWLKHQTMLVNENRLNLADARARQYLARQMENHFFGGGADAAAGYVPPSA